MKKFKIYDLRLMIFLLLSVLFINHKSLIINPVLAIESTPSADPLRQSDSEASIKAKLEDFKKEIASKAAKLKQEINRKLKDKAYAGTVKSKSDASLTLAGSSGPKMVSLNQDTVFESEVKSKQKFSQKTISEENYIAALGDIDETGVLTAKKIILLPARNATQSVAGGPTPNSGLKTYLWGQVVSISDKLITLKDRNLKNSAATLPKGSEVKLKDFVVLTGVMNKNDIFEAGFVYVIPQGGILKPKKIVDPAKLQRSGATPSAKISTPSAKPKPATR